MIFGAFTHLDAQPSRWEHWNDLNCDAEPALSHLEVKYDSHVADSTGVMWHNCSVQTDLGPVWSLHQSERRVCSAEPSI